MKKIPTAKEFVETFTGDDEDGYIRWDTVEYMCKKFAQIHVEAALKEADTKAENKFPEGAWDDIVDKNFIINSYPLSNIK